MMLRKTSARCRFRASRARSPGAPRSWVRGARASNSSSRRAASGRSGATPAFPPSRNTGPTSAIGSCWLVGANSCGHSVRGRNAVLQTVHRGHQGLAGENPVAQHLALQRLDVGLDAKLQPVLLDQLQDVGFLLALARSLDDQIHRPAIGQQADAIVIPLRQPDLVEQTIGEVQVVLGPPVAEFRPVERAFSAAPNYCPRAPSR